MDRDHRRDHRRYRDKQHNLSSFPKGFNKRDRAIFLHTARSENCFYKHAKNLLTVAKINPFQIQEKLVACQSIEHQIVALRSLIQLSRKDYEQRYLFTELLLTCLHRHHNVIYEGMLFGSTVNGLGFHDSDVDLRLRPLQNIGEDEYGPVFEPIQYDKDMVERVLRDIAFQTTRCCAASGAFVPSTRVPVAKLVFLDIQRKRPIESLKYDISLSSTNPFGTLNSRYLRFLCHLEPKFHLLASVLRYWSTVHELIVPGYLSSYALVSMLIFFCQTIEPPLLPTINQMRDLELDKNFPGRAPSEKKGMTQAEWSCIICLREDLYTPSTNTEPLAVLLLKFFEFYLNFPYSTHLITTRPGRALTFEEYQSSAQFHPKFKIKSFLNIQDPFDLAHNLTSGMDGRHFHLFMTTMRFSYERLFKELLNNFSRPPSKNLVDNKVRMANNLTLYSYNKPWGLLNIFTKLTNQEKKIG